MAFRLDEALGSSSAALTLCREERLNLAGAAASSVEDARFPASYAVDGNASTRWSSVFAEGQWIQVDLNGSSAVRRVVLRWEQAAAKGYTLSIGDDPRAPAKTIYTETQGNGGVDTITIPLDLNPVGRYLRVTSTERSTGFGISLFEIEVYGDAFPNCVRVCGDGDLDNFEQCDDGNLRNGDGCSSNCVFEISCDDHPVQPVGVKASTTEGPNLTAAYAIDDDDTSRWASVWADPQWIYVDLGPCKHSRARAAERSWAPRTYMSPEQTLSAKHIDFRADLWALGVVTYYALTCQRPFDGPALGALVLAITQSSFVPPSAHNRALPSAVDRWMLRALARDPAERFGSAREMAEAFSLAVNAAHASSPAHGNRDVAGVGRSLPPTTLSATTTMSPSVRSGGDLHSGEVAPARAKGARHPAMLVVTGFLVIGGLFALWVSRAPREATSAASASTTAPLGVKEPPLVVSRSLPGVALATSAMQPVVEPPPSPSGLETATLKVESATLPTLAAMPKRQQKTTQPTTERANEVLAGAGEPPDPAAAAPKLIETPPPVAAAPSSRLAPRNPLKMKIE